MTKLRQPSAGNERTTADAVRALGQTLSRIGDRLQDEGPRALAWYREHEGYTRGTSTEPGGGRPAVERLTEDGDPDEPPAHSDTVGEQALHPMPLALGYGDFVRAIGGGNLLAVQLMKLLNDARLADFLEDKATAELARANATAGQCDVCNHHCTGKDNDRLRTLHDGEDERGCHACVESWRTARYADPDLRYRVWQRMRRSRLQRTDRPEAS